MTAEDLSEFAIVICKDAEEGEETREDGYKEANQQENVGEEEMPTPPLSGEDICREEGNSEIEPTVKI